MSSLMDKYFNVRVKLRNDSHYNWENKAKDFVPLDGEIILYDIDDAHPYQLIKVGNGYTPVIELPFLNYIQTGKESGHISVNGNDIKVKDINTMAYQSIENYYNQEEVNKKIADIQSGGISFSQLALSGSLYDAKEVEIIEDDGELILPDYLVLNCIGQGEK